MWSSVITASRTLIYGGRRRGNGEGQRGRVWDKRGGEEGEEEGKEGVGREGEGAWGKEGRSSRERDRG